ncbi:MAG: IS1182 family transposase [Syntrophales bacterium]|nr:IS1182 family transposase [Syntrophales bacterium]
MAVPFKKDPVEFNQRLLFPLNMFDLLPEDHECYIYEEIFKQLDTTSVEKNYSVLGQNAFHPKLIVGILIYAYSQGIFSSRQIKKKSHEDLGFMYISHLNCPDFRVLSDFRKDHYEFFKECFKQSVLLAKEAGMVSLGHVSLDGSKFKADTSKHKAMSYGRLKEKERELTEQIEELIQKAEQCDSEEDEEYNDKTGYEIPEELKFKENRLAKIKAAREALEKRKQELNPGKKIDDKKQISFADKEARIMGKNGNFQYAYNGQISVDKNNQIIVGQHLTRNANDKQEVTPALQEIKETTEDELPDVMSLDNGYMSGSNLAAFNDPDIDIDVYIATGKGENGDQRSLDECNRKVRKSDFVYDEDKDCFICPACHILELRNRTGDDKKIYQTRMEDCDQCSYRNRCCKSKKGEPRTISTDSKEPLRQEMVEKMKKESSKEIYKKRKTIVEPVFGQIKKNMGFRGFSVRGFIKAGGEFSLVCAAHNIKKVVKSIRCKLAYLEEDKLASMAA